MKVRIISWSYKAIRGIDDLQISLEKEDGTLYPSCLIMMPNGTGKTTTLTLLRAVLDGQAENWNDSQVTSFRPGGTVRDGKFSATLSIDDVIYVVDLHLEYDRGKARYETSRVGEHGGLDHGHRLPNMIKGIFTSEFVKRFIFDGELANKILKSESNEAEKAIRFLYQLNRLAEMRNSIDRLVENEQRNVEKTTSAKTIRGLASFRTDKIRIRKELDLLEKEQVNVEHELKEKGKQLVQVRNSILDNLKADNSLKERAENLEKQRADIKAKVNQLTQSVFDEIRNPYSLSPLIAKRLETLSQKFQELQLPRTMSKQFFEELADSPNCICGTEIHEKERRIILERAEEFLVDDQIAVINTIKSTIKGRQYNDQLQKSTKALHELLEERDRVNSECDRLQIQKKDSGDLTAVNLEKQEKELVGSIEILRGKLQNISTKDTWAQSNLRYSENIHLCKEELDKISKKLAEATNTVVMLARAEKAKSYLKKIEDETLERLKRKIVDQTNDKISKIIRNETIYVEGVDGHLHLKEKAGASVGQTLAIAYSFLGSMFEDSPHELPFVVDSPAGALDLDVRRAVSYILPELFEQLVVFITSGERDGFADYYYRLGDDVQYLTIYRTIGLPTQCIKGVSAFKSFQSESDS